MGTLFKRSDRGGRGGNWYAQYIDAHGDRVTARSTRTSDKAAAKQILAKWEADAALRRNGVIDTAAERIGEQLGRPIQEHIDEFRASLESPGNSKKHVKETVQVVEDLAKRLGWTKIGELTMEAAEGHAKHLRDLKRSNRTVQKHLAALKQFSRWAFENNRIASDPLMLLRTPRPDVDRRLERRALHPDEWPYLRDAAGDRQLLYELTLQTGLRQNEVRHLTAGKLHLEHNPPFVLLPSRSTKNKKPARQYVTSSLAKRLRDLVKTSVNGSPLFELPHETQCAAMIRQDLARARDAWLEEARTKKDRETREKSEFLAPVNHEGHVFDFHSLRHTCGAWLAMAGENPKTIQTIMRHSTITLTMDTYGHLFPAAESDAIRRLGARHFE